MTKQVLLFQSEYDQKTVYSGDFLHRVIKLNTAIVFIDQDCYINSTLLTCRGLDILCDKAFFALDRLLYYVSWVSLRKVFSLWSYFFELNILVFIGTTKRARPKHTRSYHTFRRIIYLLTFFIIRLWNSRSFTST